MRKELDRRIVGGYVRDLKMGIESNDIDYVILGETPESMKAMGYESVGKGFPVFYVDGEENALAREEIKTGKGYGGFDFKTKNVSLETDLGRRDLTINSIALTNNGEYIDPYNGISDIENKILRHIVNPVSGKTAFGEDPTRVLRLARFTARFTDFTIAKETIILARSLKDELSSLTPERVFKELNKALISEKPSNYFRSLLLLDALENVHPEIFAMIGVPQRFDYHAEGDVFEHTMRVLDETCKVTDCVLTRYAALYHDIGKPITFKERGNFHDHGGERIIKPLFEILKAKKHPTNFLKAGKIVAEWHTFIHGFDGMKATTLVKKMTNKTFPSKEEDFEILLKATGPDERGRILGDRTLDFNEVENIFTGGNIEGFSQRETPTYSKVRTVFVALSKKVDLPKEIIDGSVHELKEFIYLEKVRRVKKALRGEI